MKTLYANVINLRVTPNELVLEFGSNFPDVPAATPPPGYQPDIRIVLAPGVLAGLAGVFNVALRRPQNPPVQGTPPTGVH
jgi:hypothetical protein